MAACMGMYTTASLSLPSGLSGLSYVPMTSNGTLPIMTCLPSGSLSPNSCSTIFLLRTATFEPALSSASVQERPDTMVPPSTSNQSVLNDCTLIDDRNCPRYRALAFVLICVMTARMEGRARNVFASSTVNRGLRRHLQVSALPSHASKLIGARLTKNVVGPAAARSFVTALLMPVIMAPIATTTNTPTETPRMVSPARTLLARMDSSAMPTPSIVPLMLVLSDI